MGKLTDLIRVGQKSTHRNSNNLRAWAQRLLYYFADIGIEDPEELFPPQGGYCLLCSEGIEGIFVFICSQNPPSFDLLGELTDKARGPFIQWLKLNPTRLADILTIESKEDRVEVDLGTEFVSINFFS